VLLWHWPAKVGESKDDRGRNWRQGEERRLEGGDVERNKGRWNGGEGEVAKAMHVKVDRASWWHWSWWHNINGGRHMVGCARCS